MRRTKLAFGLALSVAAVALVTRFFGASSEQPQSTIELAGSEGNQSQRSLSTGEEPSSSAVTEPRRANDDQHPDDNHHQSATNAARGNVAFVDEETDRQTVREEITEEVRKLYALIISDLGLSDSETEALFEFLIEDNIARVRTRYSSGQGLGQDERAARIMAIIGDTKLQQLLARERNRREYTEVLGVQSILQQNDVPLSGTQRDELLEILVDVRGQEMKLPWSDPQPGTIESLQHTISLVDEYERLVLELAPSVLSPKQVELLFDRFQDQSYRRAHSLEIQEKLRSEPGNEDIPLFYPARD